MNKQDNICKEMKDLLIKRYIQEITPEQKDKLEKHLKICGHCRHLEKTLELITDEMALPPQDTLIPRPDINRLVKRNMQKKPVKPSRDHATLFQKIFSLLDYRIPVYQAALVLVLLLLLLFNINDFSGTSNITPSDFGEVSTVFNVPYGQNTAIIPVDSIDQFKPGRNMLEDSVLTRYLVTSM
jgi:hypothetical protein